MRPQHSEQVVFSRGIVVPSWSRKIFTYAVTVAEDECLDPEEVIGTDSEAEFIWASDLTHVNKSRK